MINGLTTKSSRINTIPWESNTCRYKDKTLLNFPVYVICRLRPACQCNISANHPGVTGIKWEKQTANLYSSNDSNKYKIISLNHTELIGASGSKTFSI